MKKTIQDIEYQINTESGFLTVSECCSYFHCNKESMYEAIKKGYLQFYTTGKGTKKPTYRIYAKSVKNYRNKLLQRRATI